MSVRFDRPRRRGPGDGGGRAGRVGGPHRGERCREDHLARALVGLADHEGEVRIGGKPTGPWVGASGPARSPTCRRPRSCRRTCRFSTTACSEDTAHRLPRRRVGCRPRALCPPARAYRVGRTVAAALSTLSGGERQRVVLARALAQEAPVLLMDEPTSASTWRTGSEALEIVDELRREWGLTVVSAMHDLTLAGQFADRLLLLSAARWRPSVPPPRCSTSASSGMPSRVRSASSTPTTASSWWRRAAPDGIAARARPGNEEAQ